MRKTKKQKEDLRERSVFSCVFLFAYILIMLLITSLLIDLKS
jgi:capsule polysaccharide export protein KpsE/RkpR